jgi:hypothetical protein
MASATGLFNQRPGLGLRFRSCAEHPQRNAAGACGFKPTTTPLREEAALRWPQLTAPRFVGHR